MYFVLSRAVTCGTVDCTFVRTDAWLDFSRDLVSQNSSRAEADAVTVRLSPQLATPSFSKKRCPRPGSMWQPRSRDFLRQQERCATKYHVHTQHSIDPSNCNRECGQSPGFQCLIVTKTEGHGLLELDPLRAQTPSSCEHPFPTFREYSVQSRNVSILCQSLLLQCNLAYCDLLRSRQRMMCSPLHVPSVPSRDRCGNVYMRSAL